jgi:twinkle protein
MAGDEDVIRDHILGIEPLFQQNRTICPVCGPDRRKSKEKTLAIGLKEDVAVYFCHHCEISGKVKIEKEVPEEESNPRVVPAKTNGLSEAQIMWMASRGIGEAVIEACEIVSGKIYVKSRGDEVDAVGFRYLNADGSQATKWRDGAKNFSQTGSARSLWMIDKWTGGDLVICEGEMDALSFRQAGIFAVSVPNGAPSTLSSDGSNGAKYSYLWDAKKYIEMADRIILATDSDEPGRLLSEEIARRIGKARCWRVVYPDGCKDANDVLVTLGESSLKDVLSSATPWPVTGLRDVSEFRDDAMLLHRNGLDKGIRVGIRDLDDLFRACPQTLTIVTGVPGSGKSSFLSWLTVQIAQKHKWSTAILSAETPPSILLLQMSAILREQPYLGKNKMSEPELAQSLDWLAEKYVILDDSDTSIGSVLERAQAAVLRMGVRILVIDPFNFLTGSIQGADEGSVTNINKILVSLKSFAVEHSVAIFLVAHPVKMYRQNDGKVPVPTGYDVSGSSSFYNVADAGITVSRDGDEARITCWKARFPWIGKTGVTSLSFDIETGTFSHALGAWESLGNDKIADL